MSFYGWTHILRELDIYNSRSMYHKKQQSMMVCISGLYFTTCQHCIFLANLQLYWLKKILNVFPDGLDNLMMLGSGSTVPCLINLLICATVMTGDWMSHTTSSETVHTLCPITCLHLTEETGTTCLPGNRNSTHIFVAKGHQWKDHLHCWS